MNNQWSRSERLWRAVVVGKLANILMGKYLTWSTEQTAVSQSFLNVPKNQSFGPEFPEFLLLILFPSIGQSRQGQ